MSKKLVLFGDSLFGQVGKDRIVALEEHLNGDYDVYNCAAGGWNSDDLVRKASYVASLKPEVAVISVGTNDGSPWKLVDIEKFKANLSLIASAFKKSRLVFLPPPPVNEQRCREGKEITNQGMATYNKTVVEFCRKNTYEFLDSWSLVLPILGSDDFHNEDGVHITDKGYGMLWRSLAGVMA